jgi:hypothetical protein
VQVAVVGEGEAAEEKKVVTEPDEASKRESAEPSNDTDCHREHGERQCAESLARGNVEAFQDPGASMLHVRRLVFLHGRRWILIRQIRVQTEH